MSYRSTGAAFARFMGAALIVAGFIAATAAVAQQQPATPRQVPAAPRAPAAGPAGGAAAPALSTALPPKGTHVVFFDVDAVMRASTAMQNVNAQAEKLRTALQADASRQEAELRKGEDELRAQQNVLSADAFAQRRRDFENKVANVQQQLQTRRRNLETSYTDTAQKVQQALTESVVEVMNEQEYQMVMPNTFIFVARSSLDISGEVARRLNRRMPTAALPN
ncbi:MAG: OmpH family outer membrane protein [Rhodospirillales bacterium]|nr:OmpH family outer membrane protein [Rhodospirillales bacterium]